MLMLHDDIDKKEVINSQRTREFDVKLDSRGLGHGQASLRSGSVHVHAIVCPDSCNWVICLMTM